MTENPLQRLYQAGQSIWLDYIDRAMLNDGRLERLIERDALVGMTSNPTIFEKALAEGTTYDAQVASASPELPPAALFELIETDDVRTACDRFAPVFEETEGQDGYVSIEVSPSQAFDARRRCGPPRITVSPACSSSRTTARTSTTRCIRKRSPRRAAGRWV